MQRVLVERLERQHPRGPAADRAQRVRADRAADLREQPGDEPAAEDHEDGDPVRGRREEDRAEQREGDDERDRIPELGPGEHDLVGPPAPDEPRDHGLDPKSTATYTAQTAAAARNRHEQRGAAHRPDDERLEQPALRVAAHDPEREEDRQHRAEEERREHGGPSTVAPVTTLGSSPSRSGPTNDLVSRKARHAPDPVEREEGRREQEHDQEDLPPQALPQRVADDHGDVADRLMTVDSPPTASGGRTVSSSRRAPSNSRPPR